MIFSVCEFNGKEHKLLEYLNAQIEQGKNIVLLKGDLGSGKTTLVTNYLRSKYGYIGTDSPTFSIVNSYTTEKGRVHHFDLYRLETAEDIEDMGFFEFIDSGELCFIEWPEKIADFLPEERVLSINISVSSDECREYTLV